MNGKGREGIQIIERKVYEGAGISSS